MRREFKIKSHRSRVDSLLWDLSSRDLREEDYSLGITWFVSVEITFSFITSSQIYACQKNN